MSLKVKTIKPGYGFGDGNKNGEYYYSQGMNRFRRGVTPGWSNVASIDSGTLAGPPALALINVFVQRIEADGKTYNYGVDAEGNIYKVEKGHIDWVLAHNPTTGSYGNGLGVDRNNNLIYAQSQYLGMATPANPNVYDDDWKDLGSNLTNTPRPIEVYEDWTLIGNGNKIAGYTGDGSDFDADLFSLPTGFVINSIKSGKTGVLIGANFGDVGILVLWDCQADSALTPWIYLRNIYSITKYNGQWIVASGAEFLVTNGYSTKHLCWQPEAKTQSSNLIATSTSESMIVKNHYLFVNVSGGLGRSKTGTIIYDFETGLWEFCPVSTGDTYNVTMGALFVDNSYNFLNSFSTSSKSYIAKIYNVAPRFSYYITPELAGEDNNKKVAEALMLNFNFNLDRYEMYNTIAAKVYVKIYDFRRPLWTYAETNAISTEKSKLKINGTFDGYNIAEVGDEITVLEGNNSGETRHIKAITGAGTSSELWELDSDLTNLTASTIKVQVSPFKLVSSQTITVADLINENWYFDIKNSPNGKKFLAKILIDLGTTVMPITINEISFVYDDLGLL